MKFQNETPSCRTLHAQITHQEKLILYGGTDVKQGHTDVSELWILEPLVKQKPVWHKIKV